jgi:hypothetical protein
VAPPPPHQRTGSAAPASAQAKAARGAPPPPPTRYDPVIQRQRSDARLAAKAAGKPCACQLGPAARQPRGAPCAHPPRPIAGQAAAPSAARPRIPPPPVGGLQPMRAARPAPAAPPRLAPPAKSPAATAQAQFNFTARFNADAKRQAVRNNLILAGTAGGPNSNPDMVALRTTPRIDVNFDFDDENTPNPGDTLITPHCGALGSVDIDINVRRWFADAYDEGTLMSMFMHEIGMHVLPYTAAIVGCTTAVAAVNTAGESQDHINASTPGNAAYTGYEGLAQNMAGIMGVRAETTTMLGAYLKDMATLDVNGRRIKYPVGSWRRPLGALNDIAATYGFHRANMAWMNAHNVSQNVRRRDIAADYATLYRRALPPAARGAADAHPYVARAAAVAGVAAVTYGLRWLGQQAGVI